MQTSSDCSMAKERILRASAEMFAKYGFSGTSTREIARRAKVNEAAMYRYFATKRDLFKAVLKRELQQNLVRPEYLSAAKTESSEDPIGLTFHRVADMVTHQLKLIRLLQFSALEFGSGMRPLYRKHLGQVISAGAKDLQRWSRLQALPQFHCEVMLLSFIATMVLVQNFYRLFAKTPIKPADTKKVMATCVDLWCSVLSHRGSASQVEAIVGSRGDRS